MPIVFYTVKIVYICVFMACFTSHFICDGYGPTECMYVCMYVCMCVYMYVCVYVCIYVCMYACMYVCMYFFYIYTLYLHCMLHYK